MPPGIAQVLYVLRFLVSYAAHIAMQAEACAVKGDLGPVSIPFCKGIQFDALIIRVCRGLRRALALQEMLQQRAAAGTDIEPVARRQHAHSGGSSKRGQDRDKPPLPERLPSAEEIAAELQRRPIGAIVADICHDIGITPGDLTPRQWNALKAVIITYGGSLLKLFPAMKHRVVAQFENYAADPEHAEIPWMPMMPWTPYAGHGLREMQRARPP